MIYLDNSATTFPKPPSVKEAIVSFLDTIGANPGRSGHTLSIDSGRILYECRRALSHFIGQSDVFRTLFTLNATQALNTCLYGLLKKGDTVLVSSLEHNSIMRPLYELQDRIGINIRTIPATASCLLDLDRARELANGAKMIACVHGNNVTGALLPLAELSAIAKENDALFLVDASQSVGSIELNMEEMGIDLLCASGHKGLLGPMGTGFFSFSKKVQTEDFATLMQGGTGSKSEAMTQPLMLPDKYESGTINMLGIAGLLEGIRWVEAKGVSAINEHEQQLRLQLVEGIRAIKNLTICEVDNSLATTGAVSLYMKAKNVSEIGMALDKDFGILARVGLHCSPATHRTIGTYHQGGTVRLSPGIFTTKEEIAYVLEALQKIATCKA
ncbi:MAG: aminotransferase class V-fold PLP-dependent enzyme [Sulfurospirillaceae bacterium]|nr:aminotransferase class V-fold PLP-dependent enzyme [Sulfurospirillaceae bacterium]